MILFILGQLRPHVRFSLRCLINSIPFWTLSLTGGHCLHHMTMFIVFGTFILSRIEIYGRQGYGSNREVISRKGCSILLNLISPSTTPPDARLEIFKFFVQVYWLFILITHMLQLIGLWRGWFQKWHQVRVGKKTELSCKISDLVFFYFLNISIN